MERLTIRNSEGICVLKQPFECERCGDLQWSLPDLGNGSPIDRLAEYEDTGLTPEQIREIDRLYAEKCKELAVYQKKYINAETFLSTIENMWKVEQDLRLKLIEYKKCEKHKLNLFEDALKKGENA